MSSQSTRQDGQADAKSPPPSAARTQSPSPQAADSSTAPLDDTSHTDPARSSRQHRARESGSGGLQFENNTDSADRVFPIRSVVSVDPAPTSLTSTVSLDYFAHSPSKSSDVPFSPTSAHGNHLRRPKSGEGALQEQQRSAQAEGQLAFDHNRCSLHKDASQTRPSTVSAFQPAQDNDTHPPQRYRPEMVSRPNSMGSITSENAAVEDLGGLVTARFRHVITEDGHAVVTGRDGETLQRCEDEPIHIPGAIQSFGALMALQEEADGKLVVRVVSENSKRILGYTPKELFGLETFTDILSEDQADNLLDHIDFVQDDGTDVEANGPEVFTMTVRDAQRKTFKLWCAMHVNSSSSKLIICEFELEDDDKYPLVPMHHETPEPPEGILHGQPTEEDIKESTEAQSRPLRMLRSARKRKGEAAAMEVFNIMSQVQDQLAEAANLEQFLKILVGVVKELTGFHRVMVYQFDHEYNGKVVTELVDPRATKDLYKGLHFPASDIPKQARELYKLNKVRLLYDREQETARLVCRTTEDIESPLDMTHSYLRAMSPIHIKYLRNMAVRSSMSISINAFNELWGLISCHAYGKRGTRVSFPIRKMCRLVGDSASRNIERLSYASRLQARKLINTNPTSSNPSGYIIASSDDLLSLFDADSGLLSVHGETKILGKLQASQETLALLEYLRMRRFTSVIVSHDLRFDFQDLRYPPGFTGIAGLLLVPLSVTGDDFIVFFRKGLLKEVRWAGNPYEKFIKQGTKGFLEPRKSFKSWTETVVGKCKEWTEEELETAGVLCLVYGKFIEVWRQKQAAMHNTELTKLLLQNSAHEVRTPLNAIINYLEVALEGTLDQETRENLSKSHSASKSLIYVINDLLDLTKTEASERLLHDEAFSPAQSFHEAVDMFAGEARRKRITFEIIEDPDLPEKVIGDPRRIRQAISNITANAIEATSEGSVKVEMAVTARYEQSIDLQVVVSDTGKGLSGKQLDDLFAELEQVQSEQSSFLDDALDQGAGAVPSGEKKLNKRTLGLGLAVVARIVRNMNGQLRLNSEEGKGSRFIIVFPCELPAFEVRGSGSESTISTLTERLATPSDEVTLVGKDGISPAAELAQKRPGRFLRADSAGSVHSMGSGRSHSTTGSQRSQVDAMLKAIQSAPLVELHSSTDGTIRHRTGRLGSRSSGDVRSNSAELQRRQDPPHLRHSSPPDKGLVDISDSASPLRAIRMPNELGLSSARITTSSLETGPDGSTRHSSGSTGRLTAEKLNVLVAEDDPINSRIVEKRLQKAGHEIILTGNGEECSSQYADRAGFFDVVLMDMQMPIVDGMAATKMIRSRENTNPQLVLSPRASVNGRVPIFAVSASLMERNMQLYVDAGFDGWILKPISFIRLHDLMQGIIDDDIRARNVYKPGRWEFGGWFERERPSQFASGKTLDESIPFSGPSQAMQEAEAEDTAGRDEQEAPNDGTEG